MEQTIPTESLMRFLQATPEQRAAFLRFLDGEGLPTVGPRYALQKGLGAWRLVFEGKEAVIADGRAVQLVNWLLKHPPEEPIHASVLEVSALGAPVTDGVVGGVVQEASGSRLNGGEDTLLKRKLRELREASQDASLPEREREEAEEELRELLRAVGKARSAGCEADRAAERVRKTVRRFIDELRGAENQPGEGQEALWGFGRHLEENLWLASVGGKNRTGAMGKPGCFTYVPPAGVNWVS